MKNVLKPLVKSVLIPLGLRAVASTTDAAIQKKIFEWYHENNPIPWRIWFINKMC